MWADTQRVLKGTEYNGKLYQSAWTTPCHRISLLQFPPTHSVTEIQICPLPQRGEKKKNKLQTHRGILVDPVLAPLEKDDQMEHMPSRRPPPSPACFPEEKQMRVGWKQQAITTFLKQTKAGGSLQCPYTPGAGNVYDLLSCPSWNVARQASENRHTCSSEG